VSKVAKRVKKGEEKGAQVLRRIEIRLGQWAPLELGVYRLEAVVRVFREGFVWGHRVGMMRGERSTRVDGRKRESVCGCIGGHWDAVERSFGLFE
jgi:hypothetical protein